MVGDMLEARFSTTLTPEVIRQRLEGFRQQWQTTEVGTEDASFFFQMQTPRSFWQRWTGRQPGLDIHMNLATVPASSPGVAGVQTRTEMRVDIRPRDCSREQSDELLRVVGPLLVESVRNYLQVQPRGRAEERLIWNYPFRACSIQSDGSLGPPVDCQGKDISLNGIGFYLPGQLPSTHVELHLPQTPQTPRQMTVRARVVRVQGCGDGWYEVGAVLQTPRDPLSARTPPTPVPSVR
jgi:hypothetical protein